jgi:hypothetical protein
MKKHETLQEYEYRLKQLAKASVTSHKQFRYIAKGINRIVVNK